MHFCGWETPTTDHKEQLRMSQTPLFLIVLPYKNVEISGIFSPQTQSCAVYSVLGAFPLQHTPKAHTHVHTHIFLKFRISTTGEGNEGLEIPITRKSNNLSPDISPFPRAMKVDYGSCTTPDNRFLHNFFFSRSFAKAIMDKRLNGSDVTWVRH